MLNRGKIFGRDIAGFPSSEKFFKLGCERVQGGVANDDERCIIGFKPGLVKFLQVGARQLGNGLRGARPGQGITVSVVVPVKEFWKDAQCHAERLRLFSSNGREQLLLEAEEIRFGKSRV